LEVGENSIFFLVLFLSIGQNRNYATSLKDVKTLVTSQIHDANYVGRKFFFLSFESKRFGISKTIATKNMWIERKKLFQREKQISKKSKSKSESLSFFQKTNEKIENSDKNSVTLVHLEFFFLNFMAHIIN